jgi:hypothetical protein
MTERKRKEMEDRKRKISGPQSGSSNRPRSLGNPPHQFRQNQRVPKAVSSAPASESPEQSVRRRSAPEAESTGTSSSHPSNQPEQSSSIGSRRKQGMFPLWRARQLGDAMSEEGSPATVRPNAPAKQHVPQPRAGNRSQPRYNHGRLNHLEAEVVQETPDMIVGMFLVDSHIAKVLFDTGATHSFITTSWVEAHNLPITTMSTPIQIDSAGGRIQADSICLNVSVEIRGIVFPANLIVMGTQGIDVILGMNWLDKYQAVISCDKRTIKLMSPLGEEVVTELVPLEPKK